MKKRNHLSFIENINKKRKCVEKVKDITKNEKKIINVMCFDVYKRFISAALFKVINFPKLFGVLFYGLYFQKKFPIFPQT